MCLDKSSFDMIVHVQTIAEYMYNYGILLNRMMEKYVVRHETAMVAHLRVRWIGEYRNHI
jgi:hypothetical protein